jgi:hypothetical protein
MEPPRVTLFDYADIIQFDSINFLGTMLPAMLVMFTVSEQGDFCFCHTSYASFSASCSSSSSLLPRNRYITGRLLVMFTVSEQGDFCFCHTSYASFSASPSSESLSLYHRESSSFFLSPPCFFQLPNEA